LAVEKQYTNRRDY